MAIFGMAPFERTNKDLKPYFFLAYDTRCQNLLEHLKGSKNSHNIIVPLCHAESRSEIPELKVQILNAYRIQKTAYNTQV